MGLDFKLSDNLMERFSEDRKPKKPLVILGLYQGGWNTDLTLEILNHEETRYADIWTLNDWHVSFPNIINDQRYQITRVFQLHDNFYDWVFTKPGFKENYADWFRVNNKFNIEVMSFIPIKEIKRNTIFPKNKILKNHNKNLMTSSIAWMLALAIDEGYDAIYIRRVMVDTEDELRTKQQQTLMYMCLNYPRLYNVIIDNPYLDKWAKQTPQVWWDSIEDQDVMYGLYKERGEQRKKKLNDVMIGVANGSI